MVCLAMMEKVLTKNLFLYSKLVTYKDTTIVMLMMCTVSFKFCCLPEMKKNMTYNLRIAITLKSGDITYAVCGRAAGMGPCGSCKHIGAFCYALEEFCRLASLRDNEACISKLQEWNRPRKRNLDTCACEEVTYTRWYTVKLKG